MRNNNRFATSLMALTLLSGLPMAALAQSAQAPTTQSTDTDFNAPAPGSEQYAAYKDGMDAAKLDTAARRKIDPKASHLYVHPPVNSKARDKYRTNFEAGYKAALQKGATS
jgi:hypothetical protein